MNDFFAGRAALRSLQVAALVGTCVLAWMPAPGLDPAKAITQYVQSAWNSEDGLPQNSVHAIAQTSDGFLWMGTEEGLARFDGVAFTVFTSHGSPGLASDYIQALAAAGDGSLWIGTDSGLSHWIPNRDRSAQGRFEILTANDGLAGNSVAALAEDDAGSLWVGTTRGLSCVRGDRVSPLPPGDRLPGMAVRALAVEPGGTVWIGADTGLFRFARGKLRHWTKQDGLPAPIVMALALAPGGDLWLGTNAGGLAVVHDGHILIPSIHLPWNEVDSMLWDRDGALWIAFDRHGIGRLYQGRFSIYDESRGLPSNRCTRSFFEDREGSLWLGLLDAGVVQWRDGKFKVFGTLEGLAGNYIGDVLQSGDGSVWIGSDSNGLNRLLPDGRVEIWDHRRGLPNSAVYSLLETRDGGLWIGYRSGELACIRNGRVRVYRDPESGDSSLTALFQDRGGNLWAGFFGHGAARFHDGRFEHLSTSGRVPAFAQSPDGALWIADDGDGIKRLFHGASTHFTSANGLPSNHVMCIYADPSGDVWAGTASGGLSRIRNGQIVSWTVEQGLPGTTVGSVTDDGLGYLWVGGDNGIARISKAELNGSAPLLHPVLFAVPDGLRSRETVYGDMPSTWKGSDGRIWFSTIKGAAVTDPARIRPNPVLPPVWIESATFDSRVIPAAGPLDLRDGAGNLHIAYTAPSFVAPARMQFRYRLEGFDRQWVPAGNRRDAWYTNLPPGRYTFQVQAANSDGVWNLDGASLQLFLRPPLSRTAWAYTCYALAVITLLWLIVVLRTRRLVRLREELNRVVAERTAQLEAEKAALEQARHELHTQATHDSLTGLFNRAAILDHLQRELIRAFRQKAPLGIIIADLDHFKRVNDTYGHLVGDEVIRESAARLRRVMRAYDLVGRYGGEEFLILIPGWTPEIAPARIDLLLECMRSTPFRINDVEIRLTCSFGVASYRPDGGPLAPREILSRADAALYVAKNNGRDQASFAAD